MILSCALIFISVSEKSPVSKFRYFGKYIIQLYGYFLGSCFWTKTDWFGVIKQFHEPWNYVACDAHALCVFRSFKNLKSSFSEDNMPIHALDVFIEKPPK